MDLKNFLQQLAQQKLARTELLEMERYLKKIHQLHCSYTREIPYFRALPYYVRYSIVLLIQLAFLVGGVWFLMGVEFASLDWILSVCLIGLGYFILTRVIQLPSQDPYRIYLQKYIASQYYAQNQELFQELMHDLQSAQKELYYYYLITSRGKKRYRSNRKGYYSTLWQYASEDALLAQEKLYLQKKYNLI